MKTDGVIVWAFRRQIGKLAIETRGTGDGMRHRAVIAGWLTIFVSGCAALGPNANQGPDSKTWELRRDLSRQARQAAEAREFDRALRLLGELAEADPRSAEAPARMGSIFEELGQTEKAAEAFERALSRDGNAVDALIGLGRIELIQGKPQEALERFDAAIEIDPGQASAHVGRGRALEQMNRTDEALASYFRALRHEPDTLAALNRVATIQLERSQPESALARLDHLVELASEDAETRVLRGQARLALGLIQEAIDDLRFASDHLPDRADVALLLALAFEQANDQPAARDAIARAMELDPMSPTVREHAERLWR